MKLILKNARIIDKDWNDQKGRFDLLIKNGKIEKIGKNLEAPGYKKISSKNLHVSIGFFDIGTQVGEPGFEQRENLASIGKAAAASGYTGIAPFPNLNPTIHSKSEINYLKNHSANTLVNFHPIGAISNGCKGEDITEYIDMHNNGAIAFSDGSIPIRNAGLMLRALQYAKAIDGLIINHPEEVSISPEGQIHEGTISVSLGLEGIPEMGEILGLKRDLQLQEYAQGKYCAYNISTSDSTKLIRTAKKESAKIFATVNYLNLLFTDKDLEDFNVNLKVKPPLRTSSDRKALIKAINEDHLDAITSGHYPLEEEYKKMSFAFASFGAIGIETVFPAMLGITNGELNLEKLILKLTVGPRSILGISIPSIKENEDAELCVFDPELSWNYEKDTILSKSENSPFIGHEFKGKVLGIINNKKHNLDFE